METAQEGVYAAGNIVEPQSRSGLSWSGTLAAGEGRLAAREVARKLGASTGAPARFGTRGRFFVEVGAGAAIMISGDLRGRAELLSVTQPSIVWHWAKGLFEKRWRYERW
jgi:hypothetical protein